MALLSGNLATNSRFVVSDFLSDIGKVSKEHMQIKVSKGYMQIGVFVERYMQIGVFGYMQIGVFGQIPRFACALSTLPRCRRENLRQRNVNSWHGSYLEVPQEYA